MSIKQKDVVFTLSKYEVSINFHGKHCHLTTVESEAHAKAIYDIAVYCVNSSMGAPSSYLQALSLLSLEAYSALNKWDNRNFNIDAAVSRERQEWFNREKKQREQLEVAIRAEMQKKLDRKIKKIPSSRVAHRCESGYPDVPPPMVEVSKCGDGLPQESGIYFVWSDDTCEYVGQSIRLAMRARLGHEKIRQGDKISWLPFDRSELNFAEAYYMGIMRPRRNFIGEMFNAIN